MGKSTHFIGQPMYNQALKLLDKSKILRISREKGGERYTKRFNGWTHLVVMLYAVIKRFDSLREITTSLLADTNKLAHVARSPMPICAVPMPYLRQSIAIYMLVTDTNLCRTAEAANTPNG